MTIREAIEVGAFTSTRIQRLWNADPAVHWQRCAARGLECPQEVFTQLFHEDANNEDFAAIVRAVDWGRVVWELEEISGMALRQVRVDRGFQHAVDEARGRAVQSGVANDRDDVVNRWRESRSWYAPPVMVAGDVLGSPVGFELFVGFTRLGKLLGLLDREEVAETQKHLVWVGKLMSSLP
jgi:hypothetical protein